MEDAACPIADAPPPGAADAGNVHVPGYSIVKRISAGNFSSVYLGRSDRANRSVVLKIVKLGASPRERDDAERLQREYRVMSGIRHGAVAEIYDFGELPEHVYFAMEYIPGGDLRERLRKPLSIDASRYYLRALAQALCVIHGAGILHRDLKPANVMLREDGSPVLIDFGVAHRCAEDGGPGAAGEVLGSPFYISPERARGWRVDERTDLYSLGVMFFEMLTGQRPYGGPSAVAIMAQHAATDVPRLPAHAATQQILVDRLMAKNPHARYASAEALLTALEDP